MYSKSDTPNSFLNLIKMNLGLTIRNIRKHKGFKQNSFSELCGITQAYLSQIEKNAKIPNISILKVISEKLETPLPVLFFISMEDEDIPEHKREAYSLIAPSVKSLINEFFINTETIND